MGMRLRLPLMLVLSLAAPARAQSAAAPLHLSYDAYVAGFNILGIDAGLRLLPDGYGLGMHAQTKGLVGAFLHADSRTRVDGVFQGPGVAPRRFVSAGLWRGDFRRTDIEYLGGQPVIRALVPANETERDPVPTPLQRNTVDTLSAIIMLLHDVAQSGHCDNAATTFDGRRATQVSARTIGVEMLPADPHAHFRGQATHCQIAGRQIAGFPHDAGPDDYVRRPQTADVWIASVQQGEPEVPVLMSFETRFLGHMTVYLTAATQGVDLDQFNPK
jgi:hypothetical protein